MGAIIGPTLGQGGLTFVHGYPASQAALAALDPQDPRLALRFELYADGVEFANGFQELGDARQNSADDLLPIKASARGAVSRSIRSMSA